MQILLESSRNTVEIIFTNEIATFSKKVEIILDLDFEADPIGLEILSMRFYTNNSLFEKFNVDEENQKNKFHISYDHDNDAFYLKFDKRKNQRSISQKSVFGEVFMDKNGHIQKITLNT